MTRLMLPSLLVLALAACGGQTTQTPDTPPVDDTIIANPVSVPDMLDRQDITDTVDNTDMPDWAEDEMPPLSDNILKAYENDFPEIDVDEGWLEVDVSISPELIAFSPDYARELFGETSFDVSQSESYAKEDYVEGRHAHYIDISWDVSAASGDLASLVRGESNYGGGAHGNHQVSGRILDRAADKIIKPQDLFIDPKAAFDVLAPLVVESVTAEKMVRFEAGQDEYENLKSQVKDYMPDAETWFGEVLLLASKTGDKFGGLSVEFSPYEMGSYAEGSYAAHIEQAEFRSLLKPAYRDAFAGKIDASID